MVETVVFNFPVDFDKSKQIKKKVESGELNLTLQFDRNSVNSSQTMIHASFKWQSGAVSMSSSGGFDINDALMGGFNLATNKPMFSAVYGETSNLHPRIILTGASQDDALPLTSVNEIIRSRGSAASDRVSFASKDMAMRSLADPTSEMVNMNFYFAGFMAHFQMAYIFAIISAGLISKLFRNSAAAFWALSFLCILYLAMWDRVALDHHLHEMNDPSHSVELRLTACSLTTNSFFYRNTAIKEIEAAMKQPGAPDELKQKGPEVINALKQWRQIQYMPGVDT
ncbi:MAG: hypothetical protein GC154_02845 [bacterium]|nr:hypothetical protein [bacterium]